MSIVNLVRTDLQQKIYEAGKKQALPIRLHLNELAWEIPSAFGRPLNHYPCRTLWNELCADLAGKYQLPVDYITLTRGADDGIDLLFRLFLQSGCDGILQCSPTFFMYEFYANLQGCLVYDCPLNPEDNFKFCINQITAQWQATCKIILLCSPNNPTGNSPTINQIRELCRVFKNRAAIVIDEAYIEFSAQESAVSLIEECDNLIILRTLSKAYGLASLRVGAVIAQPDIIAALNQIAPPYPLSSIVMQQALSCLKHESRFKAYLTATQSARAQLFSALSQCALIDKVYPSEANFLLVKTRYASTINQALSNVGISIKNFSQPNLQHYLRFTVGTPAQNELLLKTLMLGEGL